MTGPSRNDLDTRLEVLTCRRRQANLAIVAAEIALGEARVAWQEAWQEAETSHPACQETFAELRAIHAELGLHKNDNEEICP